MTKFLQKLSTGLATAALLAGFLAPAAFATADLQISGNGPTSHNTIVDIDKCKSTVNQSNSTYVSTGAVVGANSGNNSANGNVTGGGNVDINTGKADASLTVAVGGSSNNATPPDCCACGGQAETALISGNGPASTNQIINVDKKKTRVSQRNRTRVRTHALVGSDSGNNDSNSNVTGSGNVSVTTDNATASLDVSVTPPPSNTVTP